MCHHNSGVFIIIFALMPTKVGSVFCSLSRTSGSRKNCQESSSIGGQNRANLLPSSTSKKCRCQFFPSHRSSKFLPRVKVNGPFVFLLFSIIALNTITLAEQEHATNDETPGSYVLWKLLFIRMEKLIE